MALLPNKFTSNLLTILLLFLALEEIKATPRKHQNEYLLQNNRALPQDPNDEFKELDAFHKIRCLCLIFKHRKVPRDQLKRTCRVLEIEFLELALDMPTRWNSTDRMLKAALQMKGAIRAVLIAQHWDESVRQYKTPTQDDWVTLEEMAIFFKLFRRPTIKMQAENYPTLHNSIPEYLHLQRQLNVWKTQVEQPVIKLAAAAALEKINCYYKECISTRQATVAVVCDPRYKLRLFQHLHEVAGGVDAPDYRKAKAHFQHVYGKYKDRAVAIHDCEEQRLEDAAINLAEARMEVPRGEQENAWRDDPFFGLEDSGVVVQVGGHGIPRNEVDNWFREPSISIQSTPEQIRKYLVSKRFEFPIIMQIALDYLAIPASSAPSERVFSEAGNLISRKRGLICSENLRYVLCLRSWGLIKDIDEEFPTVVNEDGVIILRVEPEEG